ncbi:major NAD(P)H-flavin oxidoreductase domain protein [Capnocytophaga sp. oral taxon 332 str. F0381]|uniref:nitroreductase family protein n=1 Tax=Capnocytophaga sp. oral taxon 332 TaxID=712213 RepID=UPI0002A2EC88|nr:nitroreductase family protein [Capnocytophaga sp. oral taxon 332]EKY06098.1 major NAD(P)H-flavin oxidoreductase domain protein [Capnocytophaga sp. oral taxon 332 str. F0381]
MNFLEIAQKRYAAKAYRNQKISEAKIKELAEILRLAPSSVNSQPWKFTIIGDEALKADLAAHSFFNEQKVKDASHLIVFFAYDDIAAFETYFKAHQPQPIVDYYESVKAGDEERAKAWFQKQVYLAAGFFIAACGAEGIDATPMEGIDTLYYTQKLQVKGCKAVLALAVGYHSEADTNHPSKTPKRRLLLEEVVEIR